MRNPVVSHFFDEPTNTFSYVIRDPDSRACAILDSVLDFDYAAGRTDVRSADEIIAFVRDNGLAVEWILETHVHADHLSAAPYLHDKLGGKTGIGARITEVQEVFGKAFNAGSEFARDGSQFDRLFEEGDTFAIGNLQGRVLHTPGHTPACLTYVIGDAAFVHDTLFQPDFGTARADFPGGDAATLYRSIQAILELPDETRLFTGHDYMPDGREPRWESTVGEQRERNPHLQNMDESAYTALRNKRDAELPLPALMLAALQINTRGGRLPTPENNGTAYLKIPVNAF